jgi:hypothetical protein
MDPDERFPFLQDVLDELRRAGPFASIEEVNRRAAAVAAALHDARTILHYIANEGQIKLTTAGNLPRKAVNALLPELRTIALPGKLTERPRVVNESGLKYGDFRFYAFLHRVLMPLVQFGLMERRAVPTDKDWPEYEYRLALLFDRFLQFEFRPAY